MSDGWAPISVVNWGQTQAKSIPSVKSIPQEDVPQPRKEEDEKKKEGRNPSPTSPAAQENETHIAKLAQPKKPFPGGPARLNQKKKTVAFGRTVNVSQCIEGKPFAERKENTLLKSERTMNRPEENKENAVPAAPTVNKNCERALNKTPKPIVSEGGDVLTKLQEFMQVIVDKVEKIDQKVDAMETRQIVPVPANYTPSANYSSRQYVCQQSAVPRAVLNGSERGILRDLEPMLQANPGFLQAVSDLCERVNKGSKTRNDGRPHSRDRRRPPVADQFPSPNRNSVVTERIVMERSVQQPLSPTGEPFSEASMNYMMSRKYMQGNDGGSQAHSNYRSGSHYRQPSPARYRPIQHESRPTMPESNYRSIAYSRQPHRSDYAEDYIESDDDQPSVDDNFEPQSFEELPPSTDYRAPKNADHHRNHEARKQRRK